MIQFITASHSDKTLNENLMLSPCMKDYPLRIQRGFTNVAKAYNLVQKFEHYSIYVHHDVFLPSGWIHKLKHSLMVMKRMDENWGVLGVAGVLYEKGKKLNLGHVRDRGNEWGEELNYPAKVDTLDELLLITKGDFKFDENLPQDFYGADICMQAKLQGRKNYVIEAYCHHNSGRTVGGRTAEFYKAQDYFRNKWIEHLPLATTCAILV